MKNKKKKPPTNCDFFFVPISIKKFRLSRLEHSQILNFVVNVSQKKKRKMKIFALVLSIFALISSAIAIKNGEWIWLMYTRTHVLVWDNE